LLPYTTNWLDESRLDRTPVVVYGLNLLASAVAYVVLQTVIIRRQGPESPLRQAIGVDVKGKASSAITVAGILSALTIDRNGRTGVWIAVVCFVVVAILWIIPDRRIDRLVRQLEPSG
jgi:uncharacterized membrane protein